jgi:hypothetical protein
MAAEIGIVRLATLLHLTGKKFPNQTLKQLDESISKLPAWRSRANYSLHLASYLF